METTANRESIPNEPDRLDQENGLDKKIQLSMISIDKAIIVSDLHLGYEKSNVTEFIDFLRDSISKGVSKEYSLFCDW